MRTGITNSDYYWDAWIWGAWIWGDAWIWSEWIRVRVSVQGLV